MGLFSMHPPIANRAALVDDTPGVTIYPELTPLPGEHVIKKHRYSGFFGTDLALVLHEHAITEYAVRRLTEVPDLRIIGPATAEDRGAAISFTLGDIHPHDVGQVLDEEGIAVRVGHHCARPVCLRYGIPATTRASFYLYSTPGEIDALIDGLEHVRNFFG